MIYDICISLSLSLHIYIYIYTHTHTYNNTINIYSANGMNHPPRAALFIPRALQTRQATPTPATFCRGPEQLVSWEYYL